mmetsp:Transcript_75950/g.180599  ORF Transcript_75950/g.180599 Transcript_75950/m.180599 type:complete len:266 (+) Transcript_75950:87-884(+)|eukprot:CAMPEP_0178413782 /NCGR_PEP_ID=MMETSP0689_2-20121128/22703_1 /TAXON_ID=160604 /ORGANISM="Amphidinium massartii, Strain CS-259" /LENGTH=265 /DNA_ID=CAMNT_0020035061 /DNA_START=75 /DNA_END=872 /DNA_ORIENTATION=+
MWLIVAGAVVVLSGGLCVGLRVFSADVYDLVIVWMTARWYAVVFEKLPEGARVLDVGVGTATALAKNAQLLLQKRLTVVGFDYEQAYVQKAQQVLKDAGLDKVPPEGTEGYRKGDRYCRVVQRSVYDSALGELCFDDPDSQVAKASSRAVPETLRFDAAYFSGSLTVLPDPPAALKAMRPLLRTTGRIYITQTFQKSHSSIIAALKPLLKYVTTIDFGQLTTEADLDKILEKASGFRVIENSPIAGSVDTPLQTARLIILEITDD